MGLVSSSLIVILPTLWLLFECWIISTILFL